MSQNKRPNLINGFTGMYLTGNNKWVYKIKSPNGRHYMLVNRIGLAKFLNRNNYNQVNELVAKAYSHVARAKSSMRNFTHPSANFLVKTNPANFNNLVPTRNYVFRKWNNNYGMVIPRTQFGPLKLTNINHYQLSNTNLRNLRALRRQNTRNAANFARQQAAKNAERRKYVYEIYYPISNGHGGLVTVNADLKMVGGGVTPKNATRVNNHNTSNIRQKFKRWAITHIRSNYNMSQVKINAYKLKN